MNKDTVPILLCLGLGGCASLPDISTCPNDIYSYVTKEIKDVSNTISICLDGEKVLKQIYFPNSSINSVPTICRATGSIKYENGNKATITTTTGWCENGRSLDKTAMECEMRKESILCKDLKYDYVVDFRK